MGTNVAHQQRGRGEMRKEGRAEDRRKGDEGTEDKSN